jgi:enoyl-CoA hydratase
MAEILQYELQDGVATVTMDDGKVNALGLPLLHALGVSFDRAATDGAAVVLRGRTGVFSAGFDLGTFKNRPDEVLPMREAGAALAARLLGFPRPVVIACTGHAVALGAILLLCADLRIGVDRDARIQINEVQIGMTLSHFAIELCRHRLTPAHFNLAPLSAQAYTPVEAMTAGFLDELAAGGVVAATADARARRLSSLDPEVFAATKLRLRGPAIAALQEASRRDIADWAARLRPSR